MDMLLGGMLGFTLGSVLVSLWLIPEIDEWRLRYSLLQLELNITRLNKRNK